jgi:hypothetical protein
VKGKELSLTVLLYWLIVPFDEWRLKRVDGKIGKIHLDFASLESQREKRVARDEGCGMSRHDGEELLTFEQIKEKKDELSKKFRILSDKRTPIMKRQRKRSTTAVPSSALRGLIT